MNEPTSQPRLDAIVMQLTAIISGPAAQNPENEDDCRAIEIAIDHMQHIQHEVSSVLILMDHLAEVWGDEGVFRACRDRLRKLVSA